MAGEEPEQTERQEGAEDQVRATLEAIQRTVLRLLQEGEIHPQLLTLSVAMAAGQLAALASGQDVEEALGELAEVVVRSGRDHHEMLRAELLPTAGNA